MSMPHRHSFLHVTLLAALTSVGLLAVEAPQPAPPPPAPALKPELDLPKQATAPKAEGPAPKPEGPAPAPAPVVADDKNGDPALQSKDPAYLIDIAQAHLNHGFPDRAEIYARKAVETVKDGADKQLKIRCYMLLGQVLDRKNDPQAGDQYAAAIEQAPDLFQRVQLMTSLSEVKKKSKDYAGAAKILADAKALLKNDTNPNTEWLLRDLQRREIDLARQDPERKAAMIAEAEAAAEKEPENIATLQRLSEVYANLKPEPAKSLPIQEKLVQLQPKSIEALSRLSSLYQQLRQLDKALETTQKIIELAPKEQKNVYVFQATSLLIQMGKKDEGVKLFEDAIGPDPVGHNVNLLAAVYEQSGNIEKAEGLLRKSAENPQIQALEKSALLIRIADLARRRKNYDGAEAILRSVIKDYPGQKDMQNFAKRSLEQLYREQGKEFKE
jgi:tetratricopeptide (TPR) repeat protein